MRMAPNSGVTDGYIVYSGPRFAELGRIGVTQLVLEDRKGCVAN